ncbi:MAG TPA: hypothetical protein VM934_17445 [Pyrinomonadaceae bacterium]|nr:hypothetical protein [Pyrinomonadaceae bacterium]
MEKVSYLGLPNCYRLANEDMEVIVTTDVGPRIIRYGFRGEENILGEVPEASIKTELGEWKPHGGHRLWAAPEVKPRTYAPDNEPVAFEFEDDYTIRLRQKVEPQTGLEKEMTVALGREGTRVRITHRIVNRNFWSIELAPWALTIMRGGGETILPQEPYRTWDEELAPARPLVLWHYTDLNDSRWSIGAKYIRLRTDESLASPQKIGVLNKQGWAAYHSRGTLFVKTVAHREGAAYPDYGSNTETYTAGAFMEVETLAPLRRLEPGESAEHVEQWCLFRGVSIGGSEEQMEASIRPLLLQVPGAQSG